MGINFAPNKSLGIVSLVMINVIAVDSLRSLTAGAEYGFALLFFYVLAALLFFIPLILITAELATGWPTTGGVYVWVREAFGSRWGFLTIWLQWIYNVVWYPTIFSFIAGMMAYLINPNLVNNKVYMLSVILTAYWGLTFFSCFGLKVSTSLSIVGAIVGTMLPMVFIGILGLLWIILDKPSQINFTWQNFFPNLSNMHNLAFLTNILFSFLGIEMSAVHAGDVHHPERNYPRALVYSGIIIFLTLVFASLAIAIVVPLHDLNLVSGLIDAFAIFFNAYHMSWFIPLIVLLIILGSLGCAAAWIIGPARGLHIASQENNLPTFLNLSNKKNMPVGILLTQGLIVTLLCAVFLIMPNVNSSYWILSNLTAQLALVFYILMFSAAIRLRYKHAHVKRAYRIPGGHLGMWFVAGVGILTCVGAILVGFLPPSQVTIGKVVVYEAILIAGMLIFCLFPSVIWWLKNKKRSSG